MASRAVSDVVGADERDAAARNTMDADGRDRTAQQFPDPGVVLHLRGRGEDAVHAALEQHVEVAFGVGTLPVDAADQDPVALTTRLALGADHETRELRVAQVAGHDAYGAGAPGNEAPGQGVGDVFQGLRRRRGCAPWSARRRTPYR